MTQGFLLPAQTLLDLCAAEQTAAQRWSSNVDTGDLRVSVISIAQARAAIDQEADAQARQRMVRDFESLLEGIKADGGAPLDFDERAARIWQTMLHDPALKGVPQVDRQIYATALRQQIAVAEEPRPAHRYIGKLGVAIVQLT